MEDRRSDLRNNRVEPPRPWETPELERLGDLQDLILSGGGKLSVTGGDPGESRKPGGQG